MCSFISVRLVYNGSHVRSLASRCIQPAKRRNRHFTGRIRARHLALLPFRPAAAFPYFMREFNLSFTQVGALMTTFFVISGVGQAMAGFVVDRVGSLKVPMGRGLAGDLGPRARRLAQLRCLFLAAAVVGLGNSVFHPADFTLLNRRSPRRLGHVLGAQLSGSLGWAAAPVFVSRSRRPGLARGRNRREHRGFVTLAFLFLNRRLLDDAQLQPVEAPAHRRLLRLSVTARDLDASRSSCL
jgi:hypothetical protein